MPSRSPFFSGVSIAVAQDVKLLNVSYDATRELYSELNTAFADAYKADTGKTIDQDHRCGPITRVTQQAFFVDGAAFDQMYKAAK